MSDEKRCEACGELANYGEIRVGPDELLGAPICWNCAGVAPAEKMYDRIRARRRSAQPAVARGPLSAEGTPGPGVLTEHGASVPKPREEMAGACPPVAPQPTLGAFTAAVHEHLLPRLPKGWRCVTDAVRRIPLPSGGHVEVRSENHAFMCWVLDERGREAHKFERIGAQLRNLELEKETVKLALELMSRAAEKPRGGGR